MIVNIMHGQIIIFVDNDYDQDKNSTGIQCDFSVILRFRRFGTTKPLL